MKTFWVTIICLMLWAAPLSGAVSSVMPESQCPMHQSMPMNDTFTDSQEKAHDCCDVEYTLGSLHTCDGDCEQCNQVLSSVALLQFEFTTRIHFFTARLPYLRQLTLIYPQLLNPPPNTNIS